MMSKKNFGSWPILGTILSKRDQISILKKAGPEGHLVVIRYQENAIKVHVTRPVQHKSEP